MIARVTHPAPRLALGTALAGGALHQARAIVPAFAAPGFVEDASGVPVQGIRFCRPGETPVRGSCRVRGVSVPLR